MGMNSSERSSIQARSEQWGREAIAEHMARNKSLGAPADDVAQPFLSELYERLSHTREGLQAGVNRVAAFGDRVLGSRPAQTSGTKAGNSPSNPPCSADALRDIAKEIAMLTEELLGTASRIERIG